MLEVFCAEQSGWQKRNAGNILRAFLQILLTQHRTNCQHSLPPREQTFYMALGIRELKYNILAKYVKLQMFRSVVLGMGDGSMTTLTIADPEKAGIADYLLNDLPSRYIHTRFVLYFKAPMLLNT